MSPIHDDLGGLLWRRVYEAECNLDPHVSPMLSSTLRALLEQAEVPEPEDDIVSWRIGDRSVPAHGRTRAIISPEAAQ